VPYGVDLHGRKRELLVDEPRPDTAQSDKLADTTNAQTVVMRMLSKT
jgi:hypothetical protein